MEDQIRDLLKKAKVKEALQLLVTLNPEAQVLLTKYLDADKKHKLGILDYDDYSKKLAEVTYGALEYLPQAPVAPPPPPPPPPPPASTPALTSTPVPAPAPSVEQAPARKGKTYKVRNVKIFLASSAELKGDRNEFEIFINRENKTLINKGIFLELVIWEDFLDAVSDTRLQDEYNKVLRECDIVVSLFFTKVGKYTEEEFQAALKQFRETGKPKIFTYFKNAPLNTGSINNDVLSLLQFKQKLSDMGHFYTSYDTIGDLKHHFGEQLEKLGIS